MKSGNKRADAKRIIRHAAFEALEQRRLMSTVVWTGNGGTSNWSDPLNWQNLQGPINGDDIVFPATSSQQYVTNDLSITPNSLLFQGNYDVQGSPLNVSGTFTTQDDLQVDAPIQLEGNATFDVEDGSTLTVNEIDDQTGAFSVTKIGDGNMVVSGNSNYTGLTTVSDGTLEEDGVSTSPTSVTGSGEITGDGELPSVLASGGTVTAGNVNLGLLNIDQGLDLGANSTFSARLCDYQGETNSDSLSVSSGPINISGATLNILPQDMSPLDGAVFTIISNNDGHPINGMFANLPEGALLTVGNLNFHISYQGNGENDVTLTSVIIPRTWTGAAGDGLWSTPGNWSDNLAPVDGDYIDLPSLPGSSGNNTTTIRLDANVELGKTTIEGNYDIVDAGNGRAPHTITLDSSLTSTATSGSIDETVILDNTTTVSIQSSLFVSDIEGASPVASLVCPGRGILEVDTLNINGTFSRNSGIVYNELEPVSLCHRADRAQLIVTRDSDIPTVLLLMLRRTELLFHFDTHLLYGNRTFDTGTNK